MKKKKMPMKIEMIEMIKINRSSSILSGVFVPEAVAARFAIYPITVLSPVLITTPFPCPSLQIVPKKAILSVSRAFFGAVHFEDRRRSLDSPVNEELSTFISCVSIILISAGILSPVLTNIISPGTNYEAGLLIFFPFLMIFVVCGTNFLNDSIKASLLAFYMNVTTHVKVTTITRTIPRYNYKFISTNHINSHLYNQYDQDNTPQNTMQLQPTKAVRRTMSFPGTAGDTRDLPFFLSFD